MQCSRCRGLSRSTDRAFVPVLMLNELWSWFTARLASQCWHVRLPLDSSRPIKMDRTDVMIASPPWWHTKSPIKCQPALRGLLTLLN